MDYVISVVKPGSNPILMPSSNPAKLPAIVYIVYYAYMGSTAFFLPPGGGGRCYDTRLADCWCGCVWCVTIVGLFAADCVRRVGSGVR